MLQTALTFSHTLLAEIVQSGDVVIDATMGNGHDTLFLADLVGSTGHVYSFDIQEQAIHSTKEKLLAHDFTDRASLLLKGHEHIDTVIDATQPIKAAIFNLGYLPKGDKSIITLPQTTQQAIDAILKRLSPEGRLLLVIYYGHPGGTEEKEKIITYCSELPQKLYNVMTYQFINQKNNPPILLCVEKKKIGSN